MKRPLGEKQRWLLPPIAVQDRERNSFWSLSGEKKRDKGNANTLFFPHSLTQSDDLLNYCQLPANPWARIVIHASYVPSIPCNFSYRHGQVTVSARVEKWVRIFMCLNLGDSTIFRCWECVRRAQPQRALVMLGALFSVVLNLQIFPIKAYIIDLIYSDCAHSDPNQRASRGRKKIAYARIFLWICRLRNQKSGRSGNFGSLRSRNEDSLAPDDI